MKMTPEEYWNQNLECQDQKFYTAFCLLGSACSDYAVGIDLGVEKKLNWATASLYYSLVHCGRLVCFLALGDFPVGYQQLAQLFQEGRTNGGTWMSDFRSFLQFGNQTIEPQRPFDLDGIAEYFGKLDPCRGELRTTFSRWGTILSKAKKLREKGNYEGLLITHQYNHIRVTEAFESLVRVFSCASETILPEAVSLMKSYLDASQRKEYWYAFLNLRDKREGLYYIQDSLANKVKEPRPLNMVTNFISSLRVEADHNSHLATEVSQNVGIGVFGGKKALMRRFQEMIEEFEAILR